MLVYVDVTYRELYHRDRNFRVPLSRATDLYGEIIGALDVNYIGMKKKLSASGRFCDMGQTH